MQQLLPTVLALLSLALLLGAGVLWATRARRQPPRPLPTEWTLTARPVFNSEERQVYRQLREALPHHVLLSKLPLVRFTQPTDPREVRYWYDLLGASHVSFAVCSPNGRVLAAIDLESERVPSPRSLQIKQSVLAACKVRYLRCAADKLPAPAELQLLVPQVGPPNRAPQATPAVTQVRDTLAHTLASRRKERTLLWADSGYLQDSFFGTDGNAEGGVISGFGGLRSASGGDSRPGELPRLIVDPAASPLRH